MTMSPRTFVERLPPPIGHMRNRLQNLNRF